MTVLFQLAALCLLPGLLPEFLLSAIGQAAPDLKSDAAAVVLRGVDGKTIRLSRSELQKLPHIELEAVDHHGLKARYSGVALRAILDKINVPRGEAIRGKWLRAFVLVEATDKYGAVFALPEFDPGFTERVIILADTRDGQPLDQHNGPFQIVVPGEKRPARWVRMIKEIRLVDSRAFEKR